MLRLTFHNSRPRNTLKILGFRTTALTVSIEEMENIMKKVKSLENSGLLKKGVSETVQNEAKE